LRFLHINISNRFTNEMWSLIDHFEVAGLKELVAQCPNIEELALRFGRSNVIDASDTSFFHVFPSDERKPDGALLASMLVCELLPNSISPKNKYQC
jgi:hypothetical protein